VAPPVHPVQAWSARNKHRFHQHIDAGPWLDGPRGDVGARVPLLDRAALGLAGDQEQDGSRAAQAPRTQRYAVRRGLGRVEHRQRVRGILTETRVAAWKQARGVTVLAEPEQHQIEGANAAQCLRIRARRMDDAAFGGNRVHLPGRNRNVVEPCLRRHDAVASGVSRRQAALVAEVHLPARPVGARAQHAVHVAWRAAAGEHDQEPAAPLDGARGGVENAPARDLPQALGVGHADPAHAAAGVIPHAHLDLSVRSSPRLAATSSLGALRPPRSRIRGLHADNASMPRPRARESLTVS